MNRSHNFSAGPAALPIEVLQEAYETFFDFAGSGMSVMEISHRSALFLELAEQIEENLRTLLQVPNHYKVLFLQGGASLQFSQVPMNVLRGKHAADYLHTGLWSGKAIQAARRYAEVNIATSSESSGFDHIPPARHWQLNPDAAYLHYTENESVHGVQFPSPPQTSVPLVCDACSSLLSKPINVAQHGLIYAAAQKNIGVAGVTVVIIDEALLGEVLDCTSDMLNYTKQAQAGSMLNTPATFPWYLTGLTLKWIQSVGGVASLYQMNQEKAQCLYRTIDDSQGFYLNKVHSEFRSINNVPFALADASLEPIFLACAERSGLKGLKGHAAVGGIRASIYNATTLASVTVLRDFMQDFQKVYG